MVRDKLLGAVFITVLMAISFQQVLGLTCWECTWDSRSSKTNEFCNDPFDNTHITPAQYHWNYKNCTETPNHSVHCRKVIKSEKNGTTVARSCYWKPLIAPADQCCDSFTPSYIQNEECELCESDGCNTANQLVRYSFVALLSAVSMIIVISSNVLN